MEIYSNVEVIRNEKAYMINKKQNVLIILCWLTYTLTYLGRYGFSANINLIMSDFNVTKTEVGLVASFFFFSYGIGQILHGVFCKRYNKRVIISVALVVSALLNLCIFCGINFAIIKYLWLINGFTQSILWPTMIEILSKNLDEKKLKTAIITMSTTTPIGTLLVYGLSAGFVALNVYRLIFLFAVISMLFISILWFVLYNKYTKKVEDYVEVTDKTNEKQISAKKIYAGIIIFVVILAIFAIVDNLIKDGLTTWVPTILKETYLLPDYLSILLTVVLPILGTFGAVFAVFVNKYIKNYILLATTFFAVNTICVGLCLLSITKNYSWILLMILFGLIVLLMHAINNVITSMVPLYMRDKANSGLLAGLLNGFCYLGSTISSYGLGKIAETTNEWSMVFNLLILVSIICVLLGTIYAIIILFRKKRKTKD